MGAFGKRFISMNRSFLIVVYMCHIHILWLIHFWQQTGSRTPGGMRDCGRESGRQLVRTYPGCVDKDKSYTAAYRRTERAESGNHAPKLSEMTVIIGLKMGKSGLKWCEGRNIWVRG